MQTPTEVALRIAVAFLAVALTACTATPLPSPPLPPSLPQVDFTVHCRNGTHLASVKVVADEGRDRANVVAKPGNTDNPHFGKFSYNPQVVGEKFGIEVGCGRYSYNPNDADYKKPKTLSVSNITSWGNHRNFVCTPDPSKAGICQSASNDVVITPSCTAGSLGAIATSVFVNTTDDKTDSATPQNGGFKYDLTTPVTPYQVLVICKRGHLTWRARSITPTIGSASFNCTRPQLPREKYGSCIRSLPVG